MQKIYAISFWVFLSTFTAFAQDHYTPGKVYTLGDTLTGYVNSQRTARYVKFKAEDGRITEYTPHQVFGFEINERVYLSKVVETNPYGEKIKEPLFMEQLARGKVSLYYYKERDNAEHYWAEKEGKMLELHGGRKTVEINRSKYFKNDKTYQVFLQQLFSDCNKPDLHLCAFNKQALTDAVYNYNLCTGETAARHQYKKNKLTVHPGLKIGANYFSEASANFRFTPSAGLFVNVPLSRANRIFSAQVEVIYNQYHATSSRLASRYHFIDFATLLRVTYPKGFVRPFGAAGLVYGVGLQEVRRDVSAKYVSGKDGLPKLALEGGLQVPFRKRFFFAGTRYEKLLNTPRGYYKVYNFSLGIGF